MSDLADDVVAAYSAASMNSARSQQAKDRVLGPSDLGGCRAKIRNVLIEAPRTERTTPPLEAFIGTWVGEGLEQAYVASRPGSVAQASIRTELPSGDVTNGTADVVDPELDGVIDFKGRDGLSAVQHDGAPFKNLAQVMIYLLGAIQMGLVSKDATYNLVYFDRSGKQKKPHIISGTLDMDVIAEVEERVGEAKYAALWGEEAPRDEPYMICKDYCEFFDFCRGGEQPQGLIDHPVQVRAVDRYLEGARLEREGKALKASAKPDLQGIEGSTGIATVRWVHIGETNVKASRKAAYDRLDVRPVKD